MIVFQCLLTISFSSYPKALQCPKQGATSSLTPTNTIQSSLTFSPIRVPLLLVLYLHLQHFLRSALSLPLRIQNSQFKLGKMINLG